MKKLSNTLGLVKRLCPFALVFAAILFGAGAAMAEEPIKIGAITSVSGPGSYLGGAEKEAITLMIDQYNKQGGVLGRKLELVLYDDATNPDRARTMMQRLLTQDNVSVVLGSSITPSSLAMEPLAARFGVPQITMAGARVLTDPVKKWLFSVTETDVMATRIMYNYMKTQGIDQIALLSSTSGFGRAARDVFLAEAEKYGIDIVADETYAKGDTDMTAQLTRIRANDEVQAIVNLDFGSQPSIVTRNHAALGIDAPLYQSHSMAAPEYPELAGPSSEGVLMPAPFMLVAEQLPEGSEERERAMNFRQLYQERYGKAPNAFAGFGHDAVLAAVEAIRRAGSAEPAAIRDALEEIDGLVGVTSVISYSADNHGGVVEESGLRMVKIKDGGFILLD